MNLTVTMTAYRRPKYTLQVLQSLQACAVPDGVRLSCFIGLEPGVQATKRVANQFAASADFPVYVLPRKKRLGLNRNTQDVLTHAYHAGEASLLHIEDDTVLSPDALLYYTWALRTHGRRKDVFSIAGYNKPKKQPAFDAVGEREWFTCWGWAVTRERWKEILQNWDLSNPRSFAWPVNRKIRKGRLEIYPELSRVQNIGYEKGENGRSAAWYRNNHRTPFVASEIREGVWDA